MANKPDERLIILLPADLLEEVRRAAEAEDLSVSQIVRRAIRNELKMTAEPSNAYGTRIFWEHLRRLILDAQKKGTLSGDGTHGDLFSGAPVQLDITDTAATIGKKLRGK